MHLSKLFHCLAVLVGKKEFLVISSLRLSQFVSHPSTVRHCEKPGKVFLMTFPRVLRAAVRFPKSHLFSRLDNAHPSASP